MLGKYLFGGLGGTQWQLVSLTSWGAKSDSSKLENKFIGREERVLKNLESKHSILHV